MTTCIRSQVGEGCLVNPVQQTVSQSGGTVSAIHLLVTADDVKMMAEDPEQVMEEMWLRATQVGSVLENILREPRGIPRWGINE